MKPTVIHFSTILTVFLIAGLSTSSLASVETLKIEISSYISNDDARQIRRLLRPWADAKDIKFTAGVDKNGRERPFATIVEVAPRTGVSQYAESHTFDVYDIMRQLNDSRFRGKGVGGNMRVIKTEATVTGTPVVHSGFSRSYVRNIPNWRRWRPETSLFFHAFDTGEVGQKLVFDQNEGYDLFRAKVGRQAKQVELNGTVTGFDGPYPVMSIEKFRVEYTVESNENSETGKDEGTIEEGAVEDRLEH